MAKGPFEAGVLEVLFRDDVLPQLPPIDCIVGASAGALNAVVAAAGLLSGEPERAARALAGLWRDDGGLFTALTPSLDAARRLRGASTSRRVVELLRRHVPPVSRSDRRLDLRLVVTRLDGSSAPDGSPTTFEHCAHFTQDDFVSHDGRERIFKMAAASSAFPILFEPVKVDGLGPCVDGGAVNNTPIKQAIDGQPAVGTIFVVNAEPAVFEGPAPSSGFALAFHLGDILIHERLSRDLTEARLANRLLDAVEGLPADLRSRVIDAVYPGRGSGEPLRRLSIVPIRPGCTLPGNVFSGFLDAVQRISYVNHGRAAARQSLRRELGIDVGNVGLLATPRWLEVLGLVPVVGGQFQRTAANAWDILRRVAGPITDVPESSMRAR